VPFFEQQFSHSSIYYIVKIHLSNFQVGFRKKKNSWVNPQATLRKAIISFWTSLTLEWGSNANKKLTRQHAWLCIGWSLRPAGLLFRCYNICLFCSCHGDEVDSWLCIGWSLRPAGLSFRCYNIYLFCSCQGDEVDTWLCIGWSLRPAGLLYFAAATGMKWIEVKMRELGVTSNTNYKICFMLDSLAMISVHTPKYGVIEVTRKSSSWLCTMCGHNNIFTSEVQICLFSSTPL
jgi:hypothetical protein